MDALARYCFSRGFHVSGSDTVFSDSVKKLITMGVPVLKGHRGKNIEGADLVVYSSAISVDNPELLCSQRKNIPTIKRSVLLGEILKEYKTKIAVCGSHGKTTTTSMIAHILNCANVHPTAFIGGEDCEFGNLLDGEGDFAVCEACEYKKNFLDLSPDIAVVLNIDKDHCDSYLDIEDEIQTFAKFIEGKRSVVNVDDVNARKIIDSHSVTYAIENPARFTAKNLESDSGKYSFDVYNEKKKLGKISLSVAGKHNIYNALSAVACCSLCGIEFPKIKEGLENFCGVKRRNEYLGELLGQKVYCDYAHHPKEIFETLKTVSEQNRHPLVIFQPHTYSRTVALMEEFSAVLSACERLIIYKTYPAREEFNKEGCAHTLYEKIIKNGGNATYAHTPQDLYKSIKRNIADTSCILTLGAGDVYEIIKSFVKKR